MFADSCPYYTSAKTINNSRLYQISIIVYKPAINELLKNKFYLWSIFNTNDILFGTETIHVTALLHYINILLLIHYIDRMKLLIRTTNKRAHVCNCVNI